MRLDFPEESLKEAKEIAKKYSIRNRSLAKKAINLYYGKFLEINYGFSDAIKSGKCGIFLHEAKKNADCFSLTGINYLIAKELKLKPKIFSVSGMRDLEEGENIKNKETTEHSFITVQIHGKEQIIDPFYSIFGSVKKTKQSWLIKEQVENTPGKKETKRFFNSLEELTEQDYLKQMQKNRSPEGGKTALAASQGIYAGGKRFQLQYLPEKKQLLSVISFQCQNPVTREIPSNLEVFCLKAPIKKQGVWDIENGKVISFYSEAAGWLIEQFSKPHFKIEIPVRIVERYINNLETASKYFGRKTSIRNMSSIDLPRHILKTGFDKMGYVTKNNGVDKKEHNGLVDLISAHFNIKNEPLYIKDHLNWSACYFNEKLRNTSTKNPEGLLYSEKEHNEFIKEYLEYVKANAQNHIKVWYNNILAKGGFIKNLKLHQKNLRISLNDESSTSKFMGILYLRKKKTHIFNYLIDYSVHQKKYDLGSLKATEQEKLNYFKSISHHRIAALSIILPQLKMKQYQKGLKDVLSA